MEIAIAPLLPHEADAYEQVLVESYLQYERVFPQDQWGAYLDTIRRSVSNEAAAGILVAKKDGEIVGGLQLFAGSANAYGRPELGIESTIVRLLAVHPKGRRLGIAKKLMDAAFAYARQRGDATVYLHSGEIMEDAIRLYESMGFVRDPAKEYRRGDMLVKSFCYRLKD